jgi:Ca-activated chloride channel family protein
VDGAALQQVAQSTGGKFYSAASAQELREIYRDLGSSIGHRIKAYDITQWFVGTGLLLAFAAAGLSLLWTSRLP